MNHLLAHTSLPFMFLYPREQEMLGEGQRAMASQHCLPNITTSLSRKLWQYNATLDTITRPDSNEWPIPPSRPSQQPGRDAGPHWIPGPDVCRESSLRTCSQDAHAGHASFEHELGRGGDLNHLDPAASMCYTALWETILLPNTNAPAMHVTW